nr:PEGA domain-containing protein [Myxococcota bacterium]
GPYRRPREAAPARDTDPGPAPGPLLRTTPAPAHSTTPAQGITTATAPAHGTAPATAPARTSEPSVMVADELRGTPAPILAPNADQTIRMPAITDDASDPEARVAFADSVVLDPAEINSQVIRALLPASKTDHAKKNAAPAREPSQPMRTEARRDTSSRRRALAAEPRAPRRSRRGDVIFLTIAAFFMLVVGAGATYWWLASAASAAIEVRTTPAVAATVLIDGAPRGQAPLRIDGLAPGRHTLALVAEGYETTTRELLLAPSSSAILELPMTPIAGDAPP